MTRHEFVVSNRSIQMFMFFENSAFNEVAHAPPTLKLPRGATLSTEARRPGAVNSLLLIDKLKGNQVRDDPFTNY